MIAFSGRLNKPAEIEHSARPFFQAFPAYQLALKAELNFALGGNHPSPRLQVALRDACEALDLAARHLGKAFAQAGEPDCHVMQLGTLLINDLSEKLASSCK
jgi:hypothetical protein